MQAIWLFFFLTFLNRWVCLHSLLAQSKESAGNKLSKKGEFLFPINPGKPASLTGNMGEIRSNHFHGGLDIRTGWASGVPVYASKAGYVSRVLVAGDGYGNTIFLTHPDGFVTVYAHLERFEPKLQELVKRKQYEQKAIFVDLKFPKGALKYKQGDTLAISGNTGSSRGPHLHFEIRDTAGLVYNPLTFGFTEVKDNLSPTAERLALYPLDITSRVNGRFERVEQSLSEHGAIATASHKIEIQGPVGLEILARDRISNGTQNGGIFCIEVYLNQKQIFYHNLLNFPFEKSNHVNHLINYAEFRASGLKFQKLYSPDGYFQSAFIPPSKSGKIFLKPGETGDLEIHLFDVAGNKKIVRAGLIVKKPDSETAIQTKSNTTNPARKLQFEVIDNTLKIKCEGEPEGGRLNLYGKSTTESILPAYSEGNRWTFLHDLRRYLPDSAIASASAKVSFAFKGVATPEKGLNFKLTGAEVSIPPKSLFDTLYVESERIDADVIRINNSAIALAAPIFPELDLGASTGGEKQKAYAENGNGNFGKPISCEWNGNRLRLNSKYLGKFKVIKDTIAPKIKAGIINSQQARFNIYDNLSGIDKIEATINGEWILVYWDKKQQLVYTDPLPYQKPLKGEFILSVTDACGNQSKFSRTIP